MLTLRRRVLKMTDQKVEKFFVHFTLDTEPFGYLSSWDRIFREELIIEKNWVGVVSTEGGKFKVRRTKTGIFKTGISSLEVCGELTLNNNEKTIEIKIRPVWYVMLNLILVTAFLTTLTWNLFNDIVGWSICISFTILQILFLMLDLNKTDEMLSDYLNQ